MRIPNRNEFQMTIGQLFKILVISSSVEQVTNLGVGRSFFFCLVLSGWEYTPTRTQTCLYIWMYTHAEMIYEDTHTHTHAEIIYEDTHTHTDIYKYIYIHTHIYISYMYL